MRQNEGGRQVTKLIEDFRSFELLKRKQRNFVLSTGENPNHVGAIAERDPEIPVPIISFVDNSQTTLP